MKKLILTSLLLVSSTAVQAAFDLDRQSYCSTYGSMLQTIAAWRDQGATQETTYSMILGVKGITPQEKKDSIKAIYTSKEFANQRGPDFGLKMHRHCLEKK